MLRLPLDETILAVFEGQEIEDDGGAGATIRALAALTSAMKGGDNG